MKLTEFSISKLEPKSLRFDVTDDAIANLCIRVYPGGKKSWVYRYRNNGRSKRYLIGDADAISPTKARRKAKTLAGDIANNIDPNTEKERERKEAARSREGTLRAFLDKKYEPWVLVERKSGAETVAQIKSDFAAQLDKPLDQITNWEIEKWRNAKHKAGRTATTTNRKIASLKACLSKAVEWDVIDAHPLHGLKLSRVDRSAPIRLITDDEEERLRSALRRRDKEKRNGRISANQWRRDRNRPTLREFGTFVDHLEPIVLLALNTGMRRGEILNLRWAAVRPAMCSTSHWIRLPTGKSRNGGMPSTKRDGLRPLQTGRLPHSKPVFPKPLSGTLSMLTHCMASSSQESIDRRPFG